MTKAIHANGQPLRILTVAFSGLPVPPPAYGGLERNVALEVDGLTRRGHAVTLMAAKGSHVECRLLTYTDRRDQTKAWRAWAKLSFWLRLSTLLPSIDVLDWHSRNDYFTPALLHRRLPKVITFHNPIHKPEVEWYHRRAGDSVTFVTISDAQAKHVSHIGRWATIPDGFPLEKFHPVVRRPESDYLVFLGRLAPFKGAHTAIAVANATGLPLKIAGNIVHDAEGERYFKEKIEAQLVPGRIDYVGEVDDAAKDRLLGGARALLFPIDWEEPFGRVMLEAMACGTPPIAFNRGAVSEVITHGVDGLICSTADDMVQAVTQVLQIDRTACRSKVESKFSGEILVDRYEDLFSRLVGRHH